MGRELELTVTITYGGTKARLATADEAVPVVRQDLSALGLPHPRKDSISVVYPGTIRFFWIALPNSVIHKNLIDALRPTSISASAHRNLLNQISIESITLRESETPIDGPGPGGPSNPKTYNWKPDASLHAIPMGSRATVPHESSHPMQVLDDIATTHRGRAGDAPWMSDSGASGPHSRYPAERHAFNIKSEPVTDAPIPPVSTRSYYDVAEEMETDRHRTTTAGAPRVLRSVRYAHADRTPHDPEVQALRRELWEVRRRMTADVAEERVLLQKLRDRGVEEGRDADRDFVTGARIQQLEAELRDAQAGAKYERSKRHRLEAVVEDIRRECKEPFVVPALLEAFLTISNLTTEAMQED